MCGIAGLMERSPNAALRRAFGAASQRFLHKRGPDGFVAKDITPNLTFLHARLSIIDLSHGTQPMTDGPGSIAFNGEIYNYRELKHSPEPYRTDSDTEVLLRGLNEHGISFLSEADGMFAFGYYHERNQELILARDLFGIKPLYYFFDGERLAFASRLQPLMLLSKKEIDRIALAEYYAGRACRAPRTIFTDIHEIKPGEALVFDCREFRIKSLARWAAPTIAHRTVTDERESTEMLRSAMKLAVSRHLVSDVPVASFLSGGVDSSLITAMAAQENPDISAFSIGFEDPRFNESQYAAAVCQRYRLRHHVRFCGHAEFMKYVDLWPEIMDDMVADPSAVLLTMISEYARELGYKVVLCGEGADELFAGYNQYANFLLAKRLAPLGAKIPSLTAMVEKLKPGQSRYLQLARQASEDPYFYGTGRIFEPYLLSGLVDLGGVELPKADSLSGALALDLERRLPDDMLTRTDRATMHASIEARVPFLTRYVWEASAALGESLLIKGRSKKYALKKLAEEFVPRECIYRRKVGLDLPLADWLRGPLNAYVREHLEDSWQADYLHPGAMREVVAAHEQKRNNNADKIWAFVMLENNVRHLKSITIEQFSS